MPFKASKRAPADRIIGQPALVVDSAAAAAARSVSVDSPAAGAARSVSGDSPLVDSPAPPAVVDRSASEDVQTGSATPILHAVLMDVSTGDLLPPPSVASMDAGSSASTPVNPVPGKHQLPVSDESAPAKKSSVEVPSYEEFEHEILRLQVLGTGATPEDKRAASGVVARLSPPLHSQCLSTINFCHPTSSRREHVAPPSLRIWPTCSGRRFALTFRIPTCFVLFFPKGLLPPMSLTHVMNGSRPT